MRLQTDDVGTGSIEPRSLFVSPVLVVDILRNLNSNLELETRTENFPLKPGIRSSKNENKRRAEKQVNKKRDFTRITSARVIKLKHPQVLLVVLNDSSDLGKVKTILLETGLKFSIQTTKKLKEVDESERSAKRRQLHDQTNLVEKGPIRRAALLPRSGRLQQGNRVEENPR